MWKQFQTDKVVAKGIVKSGEKLPEQFEKYLLKPVKNIKISNSEQMCTYLKVEIEKF